MELKYSPVQKLPYIEFGPTTKMVFVKLTKDKKSFKYLTVNGLIKVVRTRKGKSYQEVTERVSFVTDPTLSKDFPRGFTSQSEEFTKKRYTFVRKILKKYVGEDGEIPESAIPKIAKDLTEGTVKKTTEKKVKEKIKKQPKTSKKPKKKVKKEKPKTTKKKKKAAKAVIKIKKGQTCKSCRKKLFETHTCNFQMLVGHNQRWSPIVHKGKENCKGCGVMGGGRHHAYCPEEECPRCGKKMLTCGCFYE